MGSDERVTKIERRVLSDGWARLESVDFDYRHGNGRWERQRREIYHRGHGVAVLPCDPERRCVLLVRQFRLPVVLADVPRSGPDGGAEAMAEACTGATMRSGSVTAEAQALDFDAGFILEVPAGIVEPEGVEASARAELWQEVGLRPRSLQFVCRAFVSPGSITECLYHYVALYTPQDRQADGGGLAGEGEDIEVIECPFDEAYAAISRGDIVDAKTVLLLQYAAIHIF